MFDAMLDYPDEARSCAARFRSLLDAAICLGGHTTFAGGVG